MSALDARPLRCIPLLPGPSLRRITRFSLSDLRPPESVTLLSRLATRSTRSCRSESLPLERTGKWKPATLAMFERQQTMSSKQTARHGDGQHKPAGHETRKARRAAERAGSRREQRVIAERRWRHRQRLLLLGGAASVATLLVGALIVLNMTRGGDEADGVANAPIVLPPADESNVAAVGQTLGADDAPVTVVEWGDYQCPACGIWARGEEGLLVSDYVATGKVRYEYRDMAFLGDESRAAAEAARCAGDQDSYWAYRRVLYYNQHGENEGAFTRSRLIDMARQLGLDTEAFTTCIDDDRHDAAIDGVQTEASAAGVRSTPTFIVNGQMIAAGDWDAIKQAIDRALQ